MRRVWRVLLTVLAVFLGALLALLGVTELTYRRDFSSTPLPAVQASADPAVIAQGEYVVHALAHCSACHGPADKVDRKQLGARHELPGGYAMKAGPFGTFYPSNLTTDPETGLGRVTDAALARVIRHGVDRTGRFAPMMALAVGNLSDVDLTAVVSYLRTVPPIRNEVPADRWGVIAKLISGRFQPHVEPPIAHVPAGAGPSLARGEYLSNGPAYCYGCHSALDIAAGFKITGPCFQGATDADPDPTAEGAEIIAPNLTPDPETGHITGWTEEQFVARMKGGRVYLGSKMPWENYGQMSENDVRSIYRYLRSVTAVKHLVGPTYRKAGSKP